MARFLDTTPETDLERLRKLVDECERLVANVKGSGASVVRLLEGLDEVDKLASRLEADEADIRPELGRVESVHMQLRERAGDVVKEAKAAGGLAVLRRERRPPDDRWWWHLDDLVRRRRQKAIVRAVAGIALVLALVFGGYRLFMFVFPPNPVASKVATLEAEASRALEKGDYQAALDDYREAAQVDPTDGGLEVWVSVLAYRVRDVKEGKEAEDAARKLLPGADFYVQKGFVYLSLGEPGKAQESLEQAVRLDPSKPMAYYLLGNAMAAQGKAQEAIADYDRAASLAKAQGDSHMEALARVQKAYVLQHGRMMPEPVR